MVAPVMTDEHGQAGAPLRGEQLLGLGHAARQRLLDDDRNTRREAVERDRQVRLVRRRDDRPVRPLGVDERPMVAVVRGTEPRRQRGARVEGIGDAGEREALGAGDRLAVGEPDRSGADHGDAHGLAPGPGCWAWCGRFTPARRPPRRPLASCAAPAPRAPPARAAGERVVRDLDADDRVSRDRPGEPGEVDAALARHQPRPPRHLDQPGVARVVVLRPSQNCT